MLSPSRAPIPLLELGLVEAFELGRIDVERHHALGQTERIEAGVGTIDLDAGELGRDLRQLADVPRSVLDADMRRIRILHRQDGVASHPVEIGTHAGTTPPLDSPRRCALVSS